MCCLAAAVEAFSLANGEALSTAAVSGPAALSFRTDGEGRYVLTDFRDEGMYPRVFPQDMRGMEYDAERDQALSQSCFSQAMEHLGLTGEH